MKYALWAIGIIAAVYLIRTAWRPTPPPPRIVTVHDTLRVADTLWLTKTRVKTDTQYIERIATARPETVVVTMMPRLTGVTELRVGKPGDSTIAYSFTASAVGSSVVIQPRLTQWYTPGPIKAISVTPQGINAEFWPPERASCHVVFVPCPSLMQTLAVGLLSGGIIGFYLGRQ